MPRLSPLLHYPEEYAVLFTNAALSRVEILCTSHDEARNLRARLYVYRRALLDEPDKAPEAALLAPTVRLLVRENILIAEPIPQDTLLPALQKALEHAKRSTPASDAGPARPSLPKVDRLEHADDGSIVSSKVLP